VHERPKGITAVNQVDECLRRIMSPSQVIENSTPHLAIGLATRSYARLLLVAFALTPAGAIAYLFFFQNPSLKFESHLFDIVWICAITMEGVFITCLTRRCYLSSGEPLLRWLTLGFFAFVLIYVPPGIVASFGDNHRWLWELYGPASRLTMFVSLLVGMLRYRQVPDPAEGRARSSATYWLAWGGLYLLVDLLIAPIVKSPVVGAVNVGVWLEGGALIFSALNVIVVMLRRNHSWLMLIYGISLTWLTLSSLAFILSRPWNHMWWLANAIFAGGFSVMSYGVVQAFRTTRSFTANFTQEVLLVRLAEATACLESTLRELQHTNQALEYLSASDVLTGASNRSRFIKCVEVEIARAKNNAAPFTILALDLDNLQWINECYGYRTGDEVLQGFVQACRAAMRPYDGVARVGGEEFMVLLPQVDLDAALAIGERIRVAVASTWFGSRSGQKFSTTVSVGISEYGRDGNTIDELFQAADRRRNRAKRRGRNCVVAV
jgi:two-component system cell cycle response regulator